MTECAKKKKKRLSSTSVDTTRLEKKHIRGDVLMIQQITKDVTEQAISSPRIQRLSRPSASIIRTNLCEYLVTQCDDDEFRGAQLLTRKSLSESVIHTRSTPSTNASNLSRSSADGDVMVSTTTSGLRLSIRAFAASTRYKTKKIITMSLCMSV
jgi:hypothetical protein